MPQTEFAGHVFADQGLLAQALTHSSAGGHNNERLEFLGDGLVNLIVAEVLFERWTRADEGELTRARAELVRERSLAAVARRLDVGPRIVFGPGERKSGAHRRDSILADTLEALIAAIYLDAGFERCRALVLGWFAEPIDALPSGQVGKDAKTRLQEWLQGRQQPLPVYELVEARGEEHDREFVASCLVAGSDPESRGVGSSRRAAEQQAAESMLDRLMAKHARERQARTRG